ncbi:AbfB domain-containing protein [Actinoplanes sp. GCM10030250]|uniref:AbfB domain-containing protein n=1 Tax=Actinoplanes sp. GCM10030250 TaxID=3273376 RepID=UPI00361CC14E
MTVYGSGGVHTREPRGGGLHPGVIALVVSAGIIVVAALGYWILRSPAEPPAPAIPAAAPAASPAAAASSAESAPSPAKPRLTTGLWLLSPADDRDQHLRADGEFAAISSGKPMVITVLPGLADKDCFTFRGDGGKYLRHFDYRLRFDDNDRSDLFRADATFCLEDGLPAGTIRLRSKNYPEHVLHRRDSQLFIDQPDGSEKFTAESTFTVQEPPN